MSNTRPQIVFLNRSYWPDIEATGQLLTDLCRGLATRFDVHVICGQPNSPEPDSTYLEIGAEYRDNVTIHRLQHRKFRKQNPFGRILNLVSFFFAARRYLRNTALSPQIIISETDPFLLPIAGQEFADRIGAKHCVYLQDIYPDVAEAVGKVRVPFLARFLRGHLRRAYEKASRVIVLGRCMRQRLTKTPWKIAPEKIKIVPNWADCREITPVDHSQNSFRKRFDLKDQFVVMHSGNMGLTQRLEVLISAAAEPHWPANAKLLLVGNGASRDKLLAHRAELNLPPGRVEFIHYQPRSALAQSLAAADVHVVSMHEKIAGCLCPSKLYGIMAAGRGVIAIADPETDLCQTIVERDLGWCVPPGSAAAIASAVAEAEKEKQTKTTAATASEFDLRQQRSRLSALASFDRPVAIDAFADILSEMLSNHHLDIDGGSSAGQTDHIDRRSTVTA